MSRTKRKRTPFSANRRRLDVEWEDPNFTKKWVARWFNDQDSRVERARSAGYEFVKPEEVVGLGDSELHQGNSDLNSKVSKVVGRADGNQPIRAYLLKIPAEFYEEDQAEKEKINARVDQAIRSGKAGGADIENQYGDVRYQQ